MTVSRLALLIPGALAGCAPIPQEYAGRDLNSLLSFANPALCEPGPAFSVVLGGMTEGDANEGFRAGQVLAPPPLRPAFGRVKIRKLDGYWLTSVQVSGTWLGLAVVSVHQDHPEGGDPGGFEIELAAPLAEAERRLNAAGFPAKANVEVALGEPDGYAHLMTLQAVPGRPARSLFGCGYS